MNKFQECLIVSELLPLYLENQTGEHSNQYIEEHIKKCVECRAKIKYMTDSYDEYAENKESKGKKYIFDKIKKRIITGYIIILVLVWIFIFICFM